MTQKDEKRKPRWIGEFAPNLGHDPNNPFPLHKPYQNTEVADLLLTSIRMERDDEKALELIKSELTQAYEKGYEDGYDKAKELNY
jgi:hypothetical protein